jgi:hypothetical protein
MTAAGPKPKAKRRRGCLVLLSIVLLLLVLLVGGLFVTGSMLDEQVKSSVTMEFPHAREVVWSAIQDYETHPVSAAMRQETIPLPDEPDAPAWQEDIGSTVITVRTIESDEPNRLVRRFEDSVVPMTADVVYVLSQTDDGTSITMNMTTIIRDGTWHVPLFRVMQHAAPDAGSLAYLGSLQFETDPTNVP